MPEEHTPKEFLCGAYFQIKGEPVHGGLIISEDILQKGIAKFAGYAAYHIPLIKKDSLIKIWPK